MGIAAGADASQLDDCMDLTTTVEHRFCRTPDGSVWTHGAFGYGFFAEYLCVFSSVEVVARVLDVGRIEGAWRRADGEGVSFIGVPYYIGPWQCGLNLRAINRLVKSAPISDKAVLLRVPSHIAWVLHPVLVACGHPYGLEVVGDPYEVFASPSNGGPLRPLWRWWFPRQLRRQCARASACAYVSKRVLPDRYPAPRSAFRAFYSDVMLPEDAYVSAPKPVRNPAEHFRAVAVGSLENLCKAPDVLIDAAGICVSAGLDLEVEFVGSGRCQPRLEGRSAKLGLTGHVEFVGSVPGPQAVRAYLDEADLFVLPSRAEATPRALLEAMARGLPCIGSTVGAMPELLSPCDLVPPNDPVALANKIREVMLNPDLRSSMATRNLAAARRYRLELMRRRRAEFLSRLQDETKAWICRQRHN